MTMRSTGGSAPGGARAGEALVDRGGHDLAAGGAELAAGELLDEHGGVRAVAHDAGEEEVAGEDAEEPFAELLVVDEDSLVGVVEPFLQGRVDDQQLVRPLVVATERQVLVRDVRFVVGVQVVRRFEQREDMGEAVPGQPDQLLLASDLPVVAGEPAGSLGRCEPVFDHPREAARLEALGPSAAHQAAASSIAVRSATARAAGRAAWTRTMRAP